MQKPFIEDGHNSAARGSAAEEKICELYSLLH